MSWLKVITLLFKAKGLKDNYDEIKGPYDYIKKVSSKKPANLTWDDLKYFNNETMDAATTSIRKVLADSQKAEKAKLEWPSCESKKAFMNWFSMVAKHGPESSQAIKAREQYRAVLAKFDKDLRLMLKDITVVMPQIAMNIKLSVVLVNYAAGLQKGFEMMVKVPSLSGSQPAMFFALSQDAKQYRGIAVSVNSSMKKLNQMAGANLKECQAKIKLNKEWMDNITGKAFQSEAVLKKNQKAVRPKK